MGSRVLLLSVFIFLLLVGLIIVALGPFFPIPIDYSGLPINGTGQPTKIAAQTVPTLVNGIATITSIIAAFGGVMLGIMFRDVSKSGQEAKRTFFSLIGYFLIAIGFLFGAYCFLVSGFFEWAVRCSIGGFLIALAGILLLYLAKAEEWGPCHRPEAADKP